VLVYEHEEGRGIGLMEKLRAYELQDQGLDTIEANLMLGHEVDLRNYELSVEVLRTLNIHSLQLMTNNPEKSDAVRSAGIEVVRRVSADIPANPHSARYLTTKREKLGHLFSSSPNSLIPSSTIAHSPSSTGRRDATFAAAPAALYLIQKPSSKG
jgi:GTP cyclohydrolase II